MELNEFVESIPSFVTEAIEIAKKITNNKVILSPSLTCIEDLDSVIEYLHNLWRKHLIDNTVAWNLSVDFGTLLGEMIIRENNFHWAMNDEGIAVVETDDHNQLSPITKLYKIITDEDNTEDSSSGFYNGFKALQQYYAMNEEEKAKITTYIQTEE